MALSVSSFAPADMDQAGGMAGGLDRMMQVYQYLKQNSLANQQAALQNQGLDLKNQQQQQLMPFVTPNAQAALHQALLENQKNRTLLPFQGQEAAAQLKTDQWKANNPMIANTSGDPQLAAVMGSYLSQQQQPQQANGSQAQQPVQSMTIGEHIAHNDPTSDLSPIGKSIQAAILNKNITPDDVGNPGNLLAKILYSKQFARNADADYKTTLTKANAYIHEPTSAKNYDLAASSGLNLDPSQINAMRSNGMTVPDIAASQGQDANSIQRTLLPNDKRQGELNLQGTNVEMLKAITPFVTAATAPYSQKILGNWSPKQVVDSIKNDDPDQQAYFLASRNIQQEMNNLRLNAAGAKNTKSALEKLGSTAMTNNSVYQGTVTPYVYQKMNDITQKLLQTMSASANKYNGVGYNKDDLTFKVKTPKGIFKVPPDKLDEALKRGAKLYE